MWWLKEADFIKFGYATDDGRGDDDGSGGDDSGGGGRCSEREIREIERNRDEW